MSKATRTLVPLVLGLLFVSTHVSGDESAGFDGRWKASYTNSNASYKMEFAEGRFHAVEGEQWYKGVIVINAETVPAQIDFTIRECDCGHLGKTSKGIFRWDGDVIEIRAPGPGDERPTEFDEEAGDSMRLVREGD